MEDYKNNKTLAGKEVLFKVKVHGIYQEKVLIYHIQTIEQV